MPKATPLNAVHRAAGARMVDFGGWDMPVNYGSQIDEHHAVRGDAGMFDVSHMRAPAARWTAFRGVVFGTATSGIGSRYARAARRHAVPPRLSFYLRDCRRKPRAGCPFGGPPRPPGCRHAARPLSSWLVLPAVLLPERSSGITPSAAPPCLGPARSPAGSGAKCTAKDGYPGGRACGGTRPLVGRASAGGGTRPSWVGLQPDNLPTRLQ